MKEIFSQDETVSSCNFEAFKCFAVTHRGKDHLRRGTVCQDASKCCATSDACVIAVADGHGGEVYVRSDVGSLKAAETAVKCMTEFCAKTKESSLMERSNRRFHDSNRGLWRTGTTPSENILNKIQMKTFKKATGLRHTEPPFKLRRLRKTGVS